MSEQDVRDGTQDLVSAQEDARGGPPLLGRLSELIAARMGLDFRNVRLSDLEHGFKAAVAEFGFKDAELCMRWLLSSPLTRDRVEVLASCLTVGETYFFRDRRCFSALEDRILPDLIRSRKDNERSLRIWSAGCATGEEPYSIAMLVSRVLPDLADWNITILATDINPHFLKKASEGLYSEWSFRDTPPLFRERFFSRRKGLYELLPSIKDLVTFSYLNLGEDAYPSLRNNSNAMDIIFCRNVLMYFSPDSARRVIEGFHRSLVDGGWLVVSPAEMNQALFSRFHTVGFPGAMFYRKEVRLQESRDQSYQVVVSKPEPQLTLPMPLPSKEGQQPLPSAGEGRGEGVFSGKSVKDTDTYHEALSLYERGLYAEAAEKALSIAQQKDRSAPALSLLARSYANMGRLSDALTWSEQAITADKAQPGFHYLHAIILQEQGRTGDAIASLKRALYLDPDFTLAHVALGNLYQRQGKVNDSKKSFENALDLLQSLGEGDIVPESEGMSAGRLMEIIQAMIETGGRR